MRKLAFLAGLLLASSGLRAQDSSVTYAETITADELKEFVYKLAGAEFQGRETGKKGQKLCAAYLADYFKELGMPEIVPGYFQVFPLYGEDPEAEATLQINGVTLEQDKDYICPNGISSQTLDLTSVVFAGYGVESSAYNDYAGLDVAGKAVMVQFDEPIDKKGNTFTGTNPLEVHKGEHISAKIILAGSKSAALVLVVCKDIQELNKTGKLSTYLNNEGFNGGHIPYLFVNESAVNALLSGQDKKTFTDLNNAMKKSKSPASFSIDGQSLSLQIFYAESVTGENIIGFIEGTDSVLKNEIVVITAHYDHLGVDGSDIYYGADDDGSGTAAIMEIAEAFIEAKKNGYGPRRSILIMPVSGEEKGLLGSEYYSENPVFPLENTVADLNIDMIGRIDPEHEGKENYVYVIGSDKLSSELHTINESVNADYTKLEFDYTYNSPDDPNLYYYRSDHYNFAKNNIPVIFYFTGVHEDYHQPTDTPEKLDYTKVETIAQLVFHVAWDLANRDGKIVVDKKSDFENWR